MLNYDDMDPDGPFPSIAEMLKDCKPIFNLPGLAIGQPPVDPRTILIIAASESRFPNGFRYEIEAFCRNCRHRFVASCFHETEDGAHERARWTVETDYERHAGLCRRP